MNNPRFSRRDFIRITAAAGAVLAFPAIAQQGYPWDMRRCPIRHSAWPDPKGWTRH
jgi:hypothetical protein